MRPARAPRAASSARLVERVLHQGLDPQLHELQIIPDNRKGVRLGLDLGDRGGGAPRRVAALAQVTGPRSARTAVASIIIAHRMRRVAPSARALALPLPPCQLWFPKCAGWFANLKA